MWCESSGEGRPLADGHSSFQKADGFVRDSIRHWGVDMMKGLGRVHYGPIAWMFTPSQCVTTQWVSGRCTPWWLEDMSGVSVASSTSGSGSAKWLHLLGDSRQSWLPQGEEGFTQASRDLWLLESSTKSASTYLAEAIGSTWKPAFLMWCWGQWTRISGSRGRTHFTCMW